MTTSEPSGGEQPICGFLLATSLMCYDAQSASGDYCTTHDGLSCVGCGRKAIRSCPQFVAEDRCTKPLCGDCEHKELGPHGPVVSPSEQVRQGFISVVEISLKDAQSRGLLHVREGSLRAVASAVVDDQAAHVMMQVLSGMANPR